MITNIYAYKDNQMKNYPHIFKTGLNSTCEHLVLLSIFLNSIKNIRYSYNEPDIPYKQEPTVLF